MTKKSFEEREIARLKAKNEQRRNAATIVSDTAVDKSIEVHASTIIDLLYIIASDSILITLKTAATQTDAITQLCESLGCQVEIPGEPYPNRTDIHIDRDELRAGLSKLFADQNDGKKTGWEDAA